MTLNEYEKLNIRCLAKGQICEEYFLREFPHLISILKMSKEKQLKQAQ